MKIDDNNSLDPTFKQELFEDIQAVYSSYLQLVQSAIGNVAGKIDIDSIKKLIHSSATPNTALLNQVNLSIKNAVSQYSKEIIQSYKQITDMLLQQEREKKASRRYTAIMIEIDWPPVLDIPNAATHQIIDLYDSMPIDEFRQKIESSLSKFYDEEELSRKLEEWKTVQILERRLGILEDIIVTHTLGKFHLTVPVTLSQIEGVLGDVYGHRGWMSGKSLEKYLADLFNHCIFNSPELSIESLIRDKVYGDFRWGDPVHSDINRNAILHGAKTDYGNKVNSLKCILLLDYIVLFYSKGLENEKS